MRGRRHALAAALLAVAVLSGCATVTGTGATRAGPSIVVTTNILGDIVEQVVGDSAEVTTLMPPNADPHAFEVSAQEAARMREADLLVANGLGLEESVQQHVDRAAAEGIPTFAATDHIDVLAYADGDEAGAPDPHWWTDPARTIDVVDALQDELARIDGIDVAEVERAAEAYRTELADLETEMATTFERIRPDRRRLITNHHVFGYLADRFGFEIVGTAVPGGTTLAAPSAADLHDLATTIRQADVPTIFAESSQPDRLMQALADETGIEIEVVELYSESLTEPGGGADDYLALMRTNTERIADGLTG